MKTANVFPIDIFSLIRKEEQHHLPALGQVRHGHPECSLGMFNPLFLNLYLKIKKMDLTRIEDFLPRLSSF